MAYKWPNHPMVALSHYMNDCEGHSTFWGLGELSDPWTTLTTASHIASLFSFLKSLQVVRARERQRDGAGDAVRKCSPWEGWSELQRIGGLCFFESPRGKEEIPNGVASLLGLELWGWKPQLTWLRLFFSLYISRLPLLFRELWKRSKRRFVTEGRTWQPALVPPGGATWF